MSEWKPWYAWKPIHVPDFGYCWLTWVDREIEMMAAPYCGIWKNTSYRANEKTRKGLDGLYRTQNQRLAFVFLIVFLILTMVPAIATGNFIGLIKLYAHIGLGVIFGLLMMKLTGVIIEWVKRGEER